MSSLPQTMKAAVLFDYGDLRISEVEMPTPGEHEVLISVEACAICGSDPKIVKNGWPDHPPLGKFIPGHEYAGTIVTLGEGVENFQVHDRVAVEPHKGCGICVNCIRGNYTTCLNYGRLDLGHRHYGFTCNGGFAGYAVNHINSIHKLPDSVSMDEATLITTAGSSLYGIIRIGGIRAGETVVISGPGAIGLMAVQLAKILGAGKIILTGTREYRLKLGKQLGADETINIKESDVVQKVFEQTDGLGADLIIECAGTREAGGTAIESAKKNGRIAYIGIYSEPVCINLNKVVQHNLTIIGSKAEGDWCIERIIPYIKNGQIDCKSLISHIFPLEEINRGFEVFTRRIDNVVKVVIKP